MNILPRWEAIKKITGYGKGEIASVRGLKVKYVGGGRLRRESGRGEHLLGMERGGVTGYRVMEM